MKERLAMPNLDVERLFFQPGAMTAGGRGPGYKEFRPPPAAPDRDSFDLDLGAVLPIRSRAIRDGGQVVFHVVGDTGGVNGTGAQVSVADQMARQIRESALPEQVFFARGNQEVWFYDTVTNRWQQKSPAGPRPPFGIDATSGYDPKRERIYIGGGSYPVAPAGSRAFWVYDLKTDRWLDPKPMGKPCRGSNSFPTKNAVMVYDTAHDKVLLVFHSFHDDKPERLGVYVYDPTANAWADKPLDVPAKLGHNGQVKNGFYDPALNVVFIHSAGDSRDDGTIWVYRYKR
jgi:hypothetical protein